MRRIQGEIWHAPCGYGETQRNHVKRDPARLRVKPSHGDLARAGVADHNEGSDSHGIQQVYQDHSGRNQQQGLGETAFLPKQAQPDQAKCQHQPGSLKTRALVRNLNPEIARPDNHLYRVRNYAGCNQAQQSLYHAERKTTHRPPQ